MYTYLWLTQSHLYTAVWFQVLLELKKIVTHSWIHTVQAEMVRTVKSSISIDWAIVLKIFIPLGRGYLGLWRTGFLSYKSIFLWCLPPVYLSTSLWWLCQLWKYCFTTLLQIICL